MKSPISYLLVLVLFLVNLASYATPITILYGYQEKKEATWVRSILVRAGIPSDYIELSIHHHNCRTETIPKKNVVMQLCLDNQKKLNIMKFRKKEFFWLFEPLLENN